MKAGANGVVTFSGNIATKTLKTRKKDSERFRRFVVEVDALKRAAEAGIQNIVELVSVELDQDPPRYSMRKCAGDLDDLLSLVRHDPAAVANLILPVVEALRNLSLLPVPIYHRDLKPSNILYAGSSDFPELRISDFGCAFLADPQQGRITDDTRAVGATFFRAPEYTYGRVEQVTSSGDIFSIGKLLWYLCNGVEGEVFPYTLWFPPKYLLTARCNSPLSSRLNVLIASCVQEEPQLRIEYDALLHGLHEITINPTVGANEAARLRVLAHEAALSVKQTSDASRFTEFLNSLQVDFEWIGSQISHIYVGTDLGLTAVNLARFVFGVGKLVNTVVVKRSDVPVSNWNSTHAKFHVRAVPFEPENQLSTYPFVRITGALMNSKWSGMRRIYIARNGEIMIDRNDGSVPRPYTKSILLEFFLDAVSAVGENSVTLE